MSNKGEDTRFVSRLKSNPFVPIGFAGFLGAVAYFLYNIKNRKTTSLQMYLLQLRIGAQTLAVTGICGGAVYETFYKPKK